MKAHKRYVQGFFLLIGLAACSVLALVLLVDSHGIYKFVSLERVNKYKVTSNALGRFAVGANLYLHDYDVLFIGTSRVQSGMDPRMQILQAERVFNASLGDTDMGELVYLLDYILRHQDTVKRVYFGLDFHAFSAYREKHPEFESSFINPKNRFFASLAKEIFSKRGIGDSVRTVKANVRSVPQRYWYEGHYHSEAPIDYKANIENILTYYMSRKVMFGCFHFDNDKLRALEQVLARYVDKGIELNLFISPQHAINLMMLEYTGLFDQYYDWMRDMTAMASRLSEQSSEPVRLWNFSGFNFVTTEALSYDTTDMLYFYETSHYRDDVGGMVMHVLDKERPIRNFGQDMYGEGSEAVINSIERGRQVYKQFAVKDIQNLERLYRETAAYRESLDCHLND